jgi:hypothetical protein
MSNREPWHWHMIVVPVSRLPDNGHTSSAHVQRVVEGVEAGADPRDRDAHLQVVE